MTIAGTITLNGIRMIGLQTKFLVLGFMLVLVGCSSSDFPIRPIYNRLDTGDGEYGMLLSKDHNPDARAGWHDGCKSGYAVYGNHMYKVFYQYTRDASKVGNEQYEMNWYEAYNYCRQSINTVINQGLF